MSLAKAHIEIIDPQAARNIGSSPIEVQFNPTEYTLTKGAQIAEIAIPGIDSPILQFVRGQNQKLTLDLFFDATGSDMGEGAADVTKQTAPVYKLAKIDPDLHAIPRVRFIWGSLSFKAIVESIQQKIDLFSPAGNPLRATLSITFREYKSLEEQLKALNFQSADHTKRVTVKQGDTLLSIANEAYDDPGMWRPIAEANNLTNPRRLVPGSVLEIPPLDVFSEPIIG